MNGPTFATSTAAPAVRPATRPPGPARPPHKPAEDNPAARVLTYLRLHWLVILFCGSLAGGGLAYAAWTLLPPKYESYALFNVAQNPTTVSGSNRTESGRTEFATYVKTKADLLKYEFVYFAALREVQDLPTIRQQKDPYKFFDEKLVVSAKEGSENIRLSMVGDNPDDVQKIVNAIKNAFMKEVVEREVKERVANRDAIALAKVRLANELRVKAGGVSAPGNALVGNPAQPGAVVPAVGGDPAGPAAKPPVVQAGGVVNEKQPLDPDPATERMKQASFGKLSDLTITLETKDLPDIDFQIGVGKAELNALKARLQKMLDEPPPEELAKSVRATDPDYLKAMARAKALRRDYVQQASVVRSPDAQALKDLQHRADTIERDAELAVRQKVEEAHKLTRKPQTDEVQGRIDAADKTLAVYAARREQKLDLLKRTRAELASIPNPPAEVRAAGGGPREKVTSAEATDLQTTDSVFAQLAARYEVAKLDADAPPRIHVQQHASTPAQKDTTKQLLASVAAGLMGFVLVGGLMTLLEIKARKVSSLGELRSAAPVPVVGVVPHLPDTATARDPLKRADVNEAIDKLRSYVAQTWLARGATTVTVTSPLGDEGKGFTAFGLASSLAQAGYKALLVDFDLRNPTLHPFAGVTNAAGVCELLRGEADFRRTIQVLPNGLHFLPAGKWSDEARQAAVGGRLEALLARLKEPFDCVVLHGHALLTAAESVEVARRSEVVLLCALYRDTRVPMLRKATERVATMEIPYSGVVYLGASKTEALC